MSSDEIIYIMFAGEFGKGLEFMDVVDTEGNGLNIGEWERTDEDLENGHWRLKLTKEDMENV